MDLVREMRAYFSKPIIRPWALAAPILVLIICLPLLRPVRHPAAQQISDDELARLATIQAIAEQHTLAIDRTFFVSTHQTIHVRDRAYSDQSPTMAALLAGPYAAMRYYGLALAKNQILVTYLLTLIGVTLPVAAAAGLIYRMSRLFELPRATRAALAAGVTLASGLISYGVVLNSYAPAAALILASSAAIIHVAASRRSSRGVLGVAGFCAALAAAIEPAAVVFLPLLACVIFALRWRMPARVWGLAIYLAGVVPPLVLYAALNVPITGDLRPGAMHPELSSRIDLSRPIDALEDPSTTSRSAAVMRAAMRVADGVVGDHGLLSHFPVLILGLLGVGAVMHRHWPMTSKTLAAATVAARLRFFLHAVCSCRAAAGRCSRLRGSSSFCPCCCSGPVRGFANRTTHSHGAPLRRCARSASPFR